MKKALLLSLSGWLITGTLSAQVRQRVNLESATVFLSGAELFSTAKLSLPSGETDVVLTNVAGNINIQTLGITATNGVVIQSTTFQNQYVNPADSQLSPRALSFRDSMTKVNDQYLKLGIQKEVLDEQLALLGTNQEDIRGANTGLKVKEVQRMMRLVKSKMEDLLTKQKKIEKDRERLLAQYQGFQNRISEEQRKGYQPGGQLLIKFYTPEAVSTEVALTYFVTNASWVPAYDLRVESVNKPVKLFYKAQVTQNSGIDWKRIRLTLSSGNPGEGAEAPQLGAWYLAYDKPEYVQEVAVRTSRYTKPLIEPSYPGSRSVLTDKDIEKMAVRDAASQVGTTAGVQGRGRRDRETNLQELGNSRQGSPAYTSGMQQSSMNRYTSVDAAGVATVFDIDIPYDIPSDNKTHNIGIKTYELPALYRYVAVPKLDKDAFLQAQITNWEDLNLLPASSSIFFEGSYVGQGRIEPRNVGDTMNLSLGRDKRIVIKRDRDKLYRTDRIVGTNLYEAFTYITTLRNTKKEPVTVFVTDQFPVSNDEAITIEEKEAEGAGVEENTGLATWEVKLKPGETKNLRLAYTVKHPKGRVLSNSGR